MRPAASDTRPEPALPFLRSASGVVVRLRVTPRARRTGVVGLVADANGDACLKVSVNAAPEDGRANDAVLALLAKEWRLPRGALSLKAGCADRRKTVSVAGDPDQLMPALRAWLGSLDQVNRRGR